mmetsp:Transcript_27485/g.77060  ORF Transcript_27485/g.77060 Transcript_27485/m.77060 type:complete len:341 (+) Transcript_27485:162-1184(+)
MAEGSDGCPSTPSSKEIATLNGTGKHDSMELVATVKRKLPDLTSPFRGIRQRIRKRRSRSAPPALRRSVLLEEHFRVDPVKRVVLPGVPKHDNDFTRDVHDFFNLVILVPIIALNVMNWNWDVLFNLKTGSSSSGNGQRDDQLTAIFSKAWTGAWFDMFLYTTVFYFVFDLAWILAVPKCVKSPATIIQHHVVSLLYILIPYSIYELRFGLGVCMSVEINTWFLIARRVFNKQGFSPWIIDLSFISFRVKLISICFYITWIGIRCIVYPIFLVYVIGRWWGHSKNVGYYANVEIVAPFFQFIFCILNFKWTYDLIMSKLRYWRRSRKGGPPANYKPDKGL